MVFEFLEKLKCFVVIIIIIFLSGMAKAPPLVEGPAPLFELKKIDGQLIKLSDLKGKFVILNFWASWCVPCVKEMPEFEKAHQSFKGSKIKILAINLGESKKKVDKFIRAYHLSFPVLLDKLGNVSAKYQVIALPVTYFIDPDGLIRYKIFGGEITQTIIEKKIDQIKRVKAWP